MIAFIDLDGVYVDWTKGIAKFFGLDLEAARRANIDRRIHALLPFPKNEMWRRLEAAGREFWSNLEPYADVEQLVDEMRLAKCELRLLTSPTWDPACYSGKAEWVQRRFGKRTDILNLTREKFWLAGPGRVLIDDAPANCDEWENHKLAVPGGKAILVPSSGPGRAKALDTIREMFSL